MRHDPQHLVLARYRVGSLLSETPTSRFVDAVHRNGARVWLKLPRGPEHADGLRRESTLAHRVGATLRVIDDAEHDGAPVLVLDPVEGVPFRALAGVATFEQVVLAGHRLLALFAAIHASGHAVGGVAETELVVTRACEVAFLGLDRVAPAGPLLVAQDLEVLASLLRDVLEGVAQRDSTSAADVARALAVLDGGGRPRRARELHLDWRMLVTRSLPPPPGLTPSRAFEVPVAALRAPSLEPPVGSDADTPPVTPRPTVAAPLARVPELPALVRAVTVSSAARPPRRFVGAALVAGAIAVLVALGTGAWCLAQPEPGTSHAAASR